MKPETNDFTGGLNSVATRLNNIVEFIIGIEMILLTCVVSAQVFFRYILRDPLPWSTEVARYLFISIVFLGLSSAYRRGEHIGFTVLHRVVGSYWSSKIMCLIHILVFFLMSIMVFFGVDAVQLAGRQISPGIKISMSIPYALIPIGSLLLIIQLIPIFMNELKKAAGIAK